MSTGTTIAMRGGCRCRALTVEVSLSRAPSAYAPRACDCSFCRERDAAWLSDPQGALRLALRDENAALHCRQGSGQADFIACAHCGALVIVACEIDGCLYAAVNANIIDGAGSFAPALVASPQHLSAADKRERWRTLWFPDVAIGVGPP